jgi:hypothetical protein
MDHFDLADFEESGPPAEIDELFDQAQAEEPSRKRPVPSPIEFHSPKRIALERPNLRLSQDTQSDRKEEKKDDAVHVDDRKEEKKEDALSENDKKLIMEAIANPRFKRMLEDLNLLTDRYIRIGHERKNGPYVVYDIDPHKVCAICSKPHKSLKVTYRLGLSS